MADFTKSIGQRQRDRQKKKENFENRRNQMDETNAGRPGGSYNGATPTKKKTTEFQGGEVISGSKRPKRIVGDEKVQKIKKTAEFTDNRGTMQKMRRTESASLSRNGYPAGNATLTRKSGENATLTKARSAGNATLSRSGGSSAQQNAEKKAAKKYAAYEKAFGKRKRG